MTKPQFRHDITAWMNRHPVPVPQTWWLVDGLHHGVDGVLTMIEKAHTGISNLLLNAAARLGAPAAVVAALRTLHIRVVGPVYRGLRIAHWYV